MRRITIEQGNEFKIYNRNIPLEEDIFTEQYQAAKKIFDQLVDGEEFTNSLEYINNIIAFCGERGQGKSSAMLRFTNRIIESGLDSPYEVLEIIDPTAMETYHDIIDIVISRMFREYREGIDTMKKNQQLEIAEKFQNVHKNLAILKNSNDFIKREFAYNGSIQNLSDITDSMNLKEDLINLISCYLKFKQKQVLIIPIDDLDLNIDTAYKMLEQIRKYLIIPKVVIVMAVNIDQLSLCVERQFHIAMNGLGDSKRWSTAAEAKRMTTKYMEKLFPLARRMTLPDIRTVSGDNHNLVGVQYIGRDKRIIFDSTDLGIEKGILKLIFQKTELILISQSEETHPIVPDTLRGLVNLFSVIGSMDESVTKRNLELFEEYLVNTWALEQLEEAHYSWFARIRQLNESSIYPTVFWYLYQCFHGEAKLGTRTLKTELTDAISKTMRDFRKNLIQITNSDIQNLIHAISLLRLNGLDTLTFAVKTWLSLHLLKLRKETAVRTITKYTGKNLFSNHKLIRDYRSDSKNYSRVNYTYSVKNFWWRRIVKPKANYNDFISDRIELNSVSQIMMYYDKIVKDRKQLITDLCLISSLSYFEDNRMLIASNNQMAGEAKFDISLFLSAQLDMEHIANKLNIEKWNISLEEIEAGMYEIWGDTKRLFDILVCNLECLMFLGKYLEENRDIKENVGDEIKVYYSHFFESFITGLVQIETYIQSDEFNIGLNQEWFADRIAMYADFWEARVEKGEIEEIEGSVSANDNDLQLPSYSRSDAKFYHFMNKIEDLKKYIENEYENNGTKTLSNLLRQVYDLEKKAQYSAKQRGDSSIGSEFSSTFNNILKKLR